ncbi:MAG: ABC transporter permease [Chitinophagaceae bacterium]|nr:ABC transporter permease [Chitinophagaceae bacterium]
MIRRTIEIISSSFKMAMQELWKNKLRTFLSLFGITIGIFCIIGVLATVNSLEHNIQNEIKSLGTNTIYIDKWEYAGGGPDYPWWKYVKRPSPKYDEIRHIKERTKTARYTAFAINRQDNVEFAGNILSNINIYGISDDFENIQPFDISFGRYMSDADFNRGTNSVVIGNEVAEKLIGAAEVAPGKEITVRGKKLYILGVIKKQGQQMIGGWNFDQSIVVPYRFARTMMNELRSDPVIMVQGQDNVTSKELKDDLMGTMRSIHRLSPTKDADFSLNDVNDFSDAISEAFVGLNIGGAVIGGISLIVGLFGVANIMFVTVRERTPQIGLKKALGAKRRVILSEFLLESAFLCFIGGLIGLTLVFLLTQILSGALNFPVYISITNMAWTFLICLFVGVVAGIVPAIKAAKMDPVEAIRSK